MIWGGMEVVIKDFQLESIVMFVTQFYVKGWTRKVHLLLIGNTLVGSLYVRFGRTEETRIMKDN